MPNKPQSKPRKSRAPRRRGQGDVEETPDDIVKRIDAEIAEEEQARVAKRRAAGQRWAPIMEPLFWMAILAAALGNCAGNKLPQGQFGLSALAAALAFVAAYGIHRASAVVERFPVRWFGRQGMVNGVSFSIGLGLFCVAMMGYAIYREYFA
jgi:hypothetical protein